MEFVVKGLLGKLERKHDNRTFQFARYSGVDLPTPPDILTNSKFMAGRPWNMCLNDQLGDCVIAGVDHCLELWNAAVGRKWTTNDSRIKATYFQLTGGQDDGLVELDTLNHWRKAGIFGHKIDGFMQLETGNMNQAKLSMYIFGLAYLGIALPKTAQNQQVWSVTTTKGDGAPGSWGGHCVIIVDYNAIGPVCITWGQQLQMTWQFYQTYCDEAYAILAPDWLNSRGLTIDGFNGIQLRADLNALATAV